MAATFTYGLQQFCRLWVIFDGSRRFWLPADFRLAPKADLRQ